MKVGFEDTIKWYDENAKEYVDITWDDVPKALVTKFLDFLPKHPKIIDVACGPGREVSIFHSKGIDVVGVDISKGMIAEAKRRNPHLTFIQSNFLSLPFEDNSFDGVWAQCALVHLETIKDVKKALHEFHRVLRKDGVVYIYVKAQHDSRKTAIIQDSIFTHERFFRFYTKPELKKLLTEAGFDMLHIGYYEDSYKRKGVKLIGLFARKRT